jgi:predicted metalloendopeptidase
VTTPPTTAPASSAGSSVAATPPKERSLADVGLDASWLDTTADPCDDFYQYACGGWIKAHPIPADHARYGGFQVLADKTFEDTHQLLEALVKNPGTDLASQHASAYYGACMDEASIETQGLKGAQPLLDLIAGVKDATTLSHAVARLHAVDVPVLWALTSEQDAKNATQTIALLTQGGLGLGDRDFYLSDDASKKKIRAAYLGYLQRLLVLGGWKDADAKAGAADVMALETELAKSQRKAEDMRDPMLVYNRLDRKGVAAALKAFDWDDYWKTVGAPAVQAIDVTTPAELAEIQKLTSSVKPAAWRAYLTTTVLDNLAGMMPKAFVDEWFSFAKLFGGQEEIAPRWKRCTYATSWALQDDLGQLYVKKYFSEDARAAARQLIQTISDSFADEVAGLDWMDDATKAKTLEKRQAILYVVGFPDKWRTYDVTIDPKGFTADALALRKINVAYEIGKIGKPIDRAVFAAPPSLVDAYYEPSFNHIVIPAGILQPPFFGLGWPAGVQLGAMGMLVGHELTHGFDDQGALYDKDGNLADWWSPSTKQKFLAKTACITDQYSKIESVPGVKLNGKLGAGENTADGGGLRLASARSRSSAATRTRRPAATARTSSSSSRRRASGAARIARRR